MGNQPDTWYSYECGEGCSPTTGVIADVRLPGSGGESPDVKCPVCGSSMRYRGKWAATEAGFGSQGDSPPLQIHPRHFKALANSMLREFEEVSGLSLDPGKRGEAQDRIVTQLMTHLNHQHTSNEEDQF